MQGGVHLRRNSRRVIYLQNNPFILETANIGKLPVLWSATGKNTRGHVKKCERTSKTTLYNHVWYYKTSKCIFSPVKGEKISWCLETVSNGISLCIDGDQQIMCFSTTVQWIRNVMFVNVVYIILRCRTICKPRNFVVFSCLTKFADHTQFIWCPSTSNTFLHSQTG